MYTLGTRGNSLAKSGRPKAGETSVRSEVSEFVNVYKDYRAIYRLCMEIKIK